MNDFKKILFAVELASTVSERITPYVLSMAHQYQAQIHLLYVAESLSRFGGLYMPHPSVTKFNQEMEPWARKKNSNPKSVPVTLTYGFSVRSIPSGEMFLAIEQPKLYRIAVNGTELSTDADSG